MFSIELLTQIGNLAEFFTLYFWWNHQKTTILSISDHIKSWLNQIVCVLKKATNIEYWFPQKLKMAVNPDLVFEISTKSGKQKEDFKSLCCHFDSKIF